MGVLPGRELWGNKGRKISDVMDCMQDANSGTVDCYLERVVAVRHLGMLPPRSSPPASFGVVGSPLFDDGRESVSL